MASHVVVIAASARRHTVKTTPGKYLTEVLQEACLKFGFDPEQHSLKHNNKQLDLSRTIRLSGLSSGAKLEVVQASRSPSVVSIALQLPTSGESAGTLARLTNKFPSNTSIWQILRCFEEEGKNNHNFTQRATAQIRDGVSGAGRLTYEMPVVHVMGRDMGSFTDLQKTLAQLGINNGSALLRLTYRDSQQPMEEAMAAISQYFASVTGPAESSTEGSVKASGAHAGAANEFISTPDAASTPEPGSTGIEPDPAQDEGNGPANDIVAGVSLETDSSQSTSAAQGAVPPPDKLSIFAPPSSSTPAAASTLPYDEFDYTPTVDHAKQHQARLNSESRNRKLLSDAELAIQEQSRAEALSGIREVVVRLRFPDQSQVQRSFDQDATVKDLYQLCRDLMTRPNEEVFSLRIFAQRGQPSLLEESPQQLISGLGWQGRVLVIVVWAEGVDAEVRNAPSLRDEYRQRAEQLKVEIAPAESAPEPSTKAGEQVTEKRREGGSGEDKEARMKRLLKGLTKK